MGTRISKSRLCVGYERQFRRAGCLGWGSWRKRRTSGASLPNERTHRTDPCRVELSGVSSRRRTVSGTFGSALRKFQPFKIPHVGGRHSTFRGRGSSGDRTELGGKGPTVIVAPVPLVEGPEGRSLGSGEARRAKGRRSLFENKGPGARLGSVTVEPVRTH